MKLSLSIVCNRLKESFSKIDCQIGDYDYSLEGVRYYEGNCNPRYLYLIENEEPPMQFESAVIFMAGEKKVPSDLEYPYIAIRDSCSSTVLMNKLLEIFEDYNHWDSELSNMVDSHCTLRELAGYGARKINGRIIVTDKKFFLLADSDYYGMAREAEGNYLGTTLPTDILRIVNTYHEKCKRIKEPFLHDDEGSYGGKEMYSFNIYLGNRYEGTCTLMSKAGELEAHDIDLFKQFYKHAYRLFEFYTGTEADGNQALRIQICDLLNQETLFYRDETETENNLDIRCMILQNKSESDNPLPVEYLGFTAQCLFEGCVSVLHDKRMVVYLPQYDESKIRQLEPVAESMDLLIGISGRGSDPREIKSLYLQAVNAVSIGSTLEKDKRFFFFTDYYLEYLLKNSISGFDYRVFETEGMRRLIKYNQNSSVDYLETLKIYLEQERNITTSAEILCIHRSSLLKRLENLRKLLGDELDTPQGRLLLRWQLALRDTLGGV